MKNQIEIKNGLLIFMGIAVFFMLMDFLGLAGENYLRIFNAFIVLYGINKTIKSNNQNGINNYLENYFSGIKTGVFGILLGIVGLIVFIQLKGGESYFLKLSDTFFFPGKQNIIMYSAMLFFEGVASCFIGSFIVMQFNSEGK